ncbi:MAG: hypothetical protein V2I56_07065 [Desulfobacteraceae bacterium]|jgi:hypothetical protein|nr:hypothetical protein [Desulfobacteraceae bacterium]
MTEKFEVAELQYRASSIQHPIATSCQLPVASSQPPGTSHR